MEPDVIDMMSETELREELRKVLLVNSESSKRINKLEDAIILAIEAMAWDIGGEPLDTLMMEAKKVCEELIN